MAYHFDGVVIINNVDDSLENQPSGDWLNDQLNQLEFVFRSGNLGALKDAVYWCDKYNKPLPKWDTLAIHETINSLAKNDKTILQKWSKWFIDYKQAMKDYSIYSDVKESLEHGLSWSNVNTTVSLLISNKTEEDGGKKENTIGATYKKVQKVLNGKSDEHVYKYYQLKTFFYKNDNPILTPDSHLYIKNMLKGQKNKP
ncbi:MAG: hypothetical protein WCG16_13425 [Methylococcales bacterium]